MATKTPKNPITLYGSGPMGVIKEEGNLIQIRDGRGDPTLKVVEFVPKGKRNPVAKSGDSRRPMLIVLAGHGHPEPPSGFIEDKSTPGYTVQKSKYSMYDPRYEMDFNIFANALLAKLDPSVIMLDQRYNKSEELPAE